MFDVKSIKPLASALPRRADMNRIANCSASPSRLGAVRNDPPILRSGSATTSTSGRRLCAIICRHLGGINAWGEGIAGQHDASDVDDLRPTRPRGPRCRSTPSLSRQLAQPVFTVIVNEPVPVLSLGEL